MTSLLGNRWQQKWGGNSRPGRDVDAAVPVRRPRRSGTCAERQRPGVHREELQRWLERAADCMLYIQKASPWGNGYVESFNGKLRKNCQPANEYEIGRAPGAQNWLLEIHKLRLLLEPPAAARASRYIPEEILNQLAFPAASAVPEMNPDWTKRARLFDYALHLAIADHSANQPLRGRHLQMLGIQTTVIRIGNRPNDSVVRGYHEHLSILQALKAGDAASASAPWNSPCNTRPSYRPARHVI